MRTLILALSLLATPALAQRPPGLPPVPSELGHSHPVTAKPKHKTTPVVQPPHAPAKAAASTKPKTLAGKPTPPVVAPAAVPAPAAQEAPVPPEQAKGSVTGQPLPRWAALRSDEVNLRAGPGTRYPIDWVYHRRDLPVRIEREFEVWRLVEDQDGVKGWVHQATLVGRRGFVVKSTQPVTMRASASDDAAAVALLKPGVVGHIRSCEAKSVWCEMQVADYRGWLKRDSVYGLNPDEAVAP